ncbi:membrane-spanning 4-domains subfamily A member 4D-like isoform X2 [Ptychodera flava]|uniref:membrane-spanning 4-domains subfamily A member 4D-like isoform X2 n=1 Tax=Ptychodera flava TaxID=63121 RepID=UPI00396A0B3E
MNSQEQGRLPMPQIVDAPQQQTTYLQVPVTAGSLVSNFAHKASSGFGIYQIVFGIILTLLGIVEIAAGYPPFVRSPIWCGIFIIVTGSIGIVAARRKTKGMIIATLTCCIIAASLSGGLVLPMSLTTTVFASLDGESILGCVVYTITTLVALTECVIAIIHSVVCCRAVCCGQQQMIPVYCHVQGQPNAPMQPVTTPVEAPRSVFMISQGVPLTGQIAGYQGPPPEQFQSYNPQGRYPQGQLNISPEQIMYTEQFPSMDSKPCR